MAQEMGRIEDKLLQLLRRPASGGGIDPGLLLQLFDYLQDLLDELGTADPAGGYIITGPCEAPINGEPAPAKGAFWESSLGMQEAIVKRLDALAELLQHHKDLRQPICTPGRAVGQPVTVTFEEVPEE